MDSWHPSDNGIPHPVYYCSVAGAFIKPLRSLKGGGLDWKIGLEQVTSWACGTTNGTAVFAVTLGCLLELHMVAIHGSGVEEIPCGVAQDAAIQI